LRVKITSSIIVPSCCGQPVSLASNVSVSVRVLPSTIADIGSSPLIVNI